MRIKGVVHNGVVVFDRSANLPEGTRVSVTPLPARPPSPGATPTQIVCEPGKLPYVRGGTPGTWILTNDDIAQIFEEDDIQSTRGFGNVSS